jgi:predicted transcriptional regulator
MDQNRRRTRPLASPAGLALASLGYGRASLAERLGVTTQMVGLYLSGARTQHPHLDSALRSLVGEEHARNILALVPPCEHPWRRAV